MPRPLTIAVQGCCHGALDTVYRELLERPQLPDLLIVGGDFQSVRNLSDLSCMSVPPKFRTLGDFASYYAGTKTAPVLTLFVGGNHEASNFLQELPYGGWVAPNIYYLGLSNVLAFGGLTIAGVSGIYHRRDYVRGHFERVPYDENTLRSVYHVRQYHVRKLLRYRVKQVDVMLSHDWPRGVTRSGDARGLVRQKPFFKGEVERNELGSPAGEELMEGLRPRYWFAAHLHVRFEAVVRHRGKDAVKEKRRRSEDGVNGRQVRAPATEDRQQTGTKNPDEILLDLEDDDDDEQAVIRTKEHGNQIPSDQQSCQVGKAGNPDEIELSLDDDDDDVPTEPVKPMAEELTLNEYKLQVLKRNGLENTHSASAKTKPESAEIRLDETHFLALDKCLPRRKFLEILTIPSVGDPSDNSEPQLSLKYDAEWLAITKTYAPFFSTSSFQKRLPALDSELVANRTWVTENVKDLNVPLNFVHTGPIQDHTITERTQPVVHENPQTVQFCQMLGISVP